MNQLKLSKRQDEKMGKSQDYLSQLCGKPSTHEIFEKSKLKILLLPNSIKFWDEILSTMKQKHRSVWVISYFGFFANPHPRLSLHRLKLFKLSPHWLFRETLFLLFFSRNIWHPKISYRPSFGIVHTYHLYSLSTIYLYYAPWILVHASKL